MRWVFQKKKKKDCCLKFNDYQGLGAESLGTSPDNKQASDNSSLLNNYIPKLFF